MASLECLLTKPASCQWQCRGVGDSRQNMSAFLSRPHQAYPHVLEKRNLGRADIYPTGGVRADRRSTHKFCSRRKILPLVLSKPFQTGWSNRRELLNPRISNFVTRSVERWNILQMETEGTPSGSNFPFEGTEIANLYLSLSNVIKDVTTSELLAFAIVATVLGTTAAYIVQQRKNRGGRKSSRELADYNQQSSPSGDNSSPALLDSAETGAAQAWLNLSEPSTFYRTVAARCPSLSTSTGDKYLQRRSFEKPEYQRRCLSAHDGGTVALDWPSHLELDSNEELESVLLLVCGTTEGSDEYGIRKFSLLVEQHGYFPVILNPRGCGGSPLTTPRVFSAADSDDIRLAADFLATLRPGATILSIGWGVGASMLARYLGEEASSTPLTAAVCVDNPFDLNEAIQATSGSRWLHFDRAMAKGLVQILDSNKMLFQGEKKGFDVSRALAATSVRDFDKAISRIVHGYETVSDFYIRTSSRASIERVQIPLLCIQHTDDYNGTQIPIPRRVFERNPYTMLLVSQAAGSGKDHPGAASEWTHLVSLEWLAAVEISLLKGRHPLPQYNSTIKLPRERSSVGNQLSGSSLVAVGPSAPSTVPSGTSGNSEEVAPVEAYNVAETSTSHPKETSQILVYKSTLEFAEKEILQQTSVEAREQKEESRRGGAAASKASDRESTKDSKSSGDSEEGQELEQQTAGEEEQGKLRQDGPEVSKAPDRGDGIVASKAPDPGNGAVASKAHEKGDSTAEFEKNPAGKEQKEEYREDGTAASKGPDRENGTVVSKTPQKGDGTVASKAPDRETTKGSKSSDRGGEEHNLEQQPAENEHKEELTRDGAVASKAPHGESTKDSKSSGNSEEHQESEQEPPGEELTETEEAERGQILQVTESVMKLLDVTMPGTLKDAQKQQVLKAVERGETVVTALEGAVPEDVRGKMSGAVNEVVQGQGLSTKLAAFGKIMPSSALPAVTEGLEAKFAAFTGKKESPNSSQDVPMASKVKSSDDSGNVAQSANDKSTKDTGKSTGAANVEDQSRGKGDQGAKKTEQPQGPVDKAAGGSSDGAPQVKGDSGDSKPQQSSSNDAPQAKSDSGDSKPDQSSSIEKDAKASSGAASKAESTASPSSQDGQQTPGNDAPSTKTSGDASSSPPPSPQASQSDPSSTAAASAPPKDTDTSGSPPSPTSQNKDSPTAPPSPASENKKSPSAPPNAASQNPDPQSGPPSPAPQSPNPQSAPPSPAPQDPNAQSAPPSPAPQNPNPPPPPSPAPQSPNPPPAPPSPAPQFPSVGEALQALTGFDDSTQMAVTNVFGVVENVIDQLENDPPTDAKATDAKQNVIHEAHAEMTEKLDLNATDPKDSEEGESERSTQDKQSTKAENSNKGAVEIINKESETRPSTGESQERNRLKVKQSPAEAERADLRNSSFDTTSNNGGVKHFLDRERGYIKVGTNRGSEDVAEQYTGSEKDEGEGNRPPPQSSSSPSNNSSNGAAKSASPKEVDSSGPAESANDKRLKSMTAEIEAGGDETSESSAAGQVAAEKDGGTKDGNSNVVTSLIMNALQLEVVRRLGGAGLEALGIDLGQEVVKVANAVSSAVTSGQSQLLGVVSNELKSEESDPGSGGKLGTLNGNIVFSALDSVLGSNSLLGGLLPVGVLAGVVLAALGAVYLIVSDDEEEESAQVKKNTSQIEHQANGSSGSRSAKHTENSGELESEGFEQHGNGNVKHSIAGETHRENSEIHGEDNNFTEQGEESELPHRGKMMGAMAAAVGATAAVATTDHGNTATNAGSGNASGESRVPDLAAKAFSVVSPVVPKTEDGKVDQERVVAMLTEVGQRGGPLILVGKAALLWGGLRGAMSLADRILAFLHMGDRPLLQRLLGFGGMAVVLWTPVLVPLLPTLLQQWATGSPGGVADAAAGIGLYGAVFILVTIWGRRVRGYERPLVAYGLEMFSRARLRLFAGGIAIGLSIVSGYYGINWGLGYANFAWESIVVENPAFPGALASTVLTSWKLLTMLGQSLTMAAAVSLVEEVLFRAWLQEEIAADFGYDWGILLSALAFAVVHWSPQAIVGLWFLGVAFAGARARMDGGLTLPVGIHTGIVTAYSVVNMGGLVRFLPDAPIWFTGANAGNPLAGALGTGMAAALAIALYPRQPQRLPEKESENLLEEESERFTED